MPEIPESAKLKKEDIVAADDWWEGASDNVFKRLLIIANAASEKAVKAERKKTGKWLENIRHVIVWDEAISYIDTSVLLKGIEALLRGENPEGIGGGE